MKSHRRSLIGISIVVAIALVSVGYLSRPEIEQKQLGAGDTANAENDVAAPTIVPESSSPFVPTAVLHSALTELCNSDDQESDGDLSADEKQARIDEYNELPQKVADLLAVSPSAEHLHLAAILEKDAATRIELLERAIALNPNDAFLLWDAVQICASARDANACRRQDWEQKLLVIDGQNSESWVQVAANRYAAGQTEAALDAMRYASTAAVSWSYWTEMIEMIEGGLAAASELSFSDRVGMAFGVAAAQQAHYIDYVAMCKEQSANNAEWAHTCLAYGELVENQGKTQMNVGIGRAMQKLALEALGDGEGAMVVKQRGKAVQERRMALLKPLGNNYMAGARLMNSSPDFLAAYLASIREHGEDFAIDYWVTEVARIIAKQPELACDL